MAVNLVLRLVSFSSTLQRGMAIAPVVDDEYLRYSTPPIVWDARRLCVLYSVGIHPSLPTEDELSPLARFSKHIGVF